MPATENPAYVGVDEEELEGSSVDTEAGLKDGTLTAEQPVPPLLCCVLFLFLQTSFFFSDFRQPGNIRQPIRT